MFVGVLYSVSIEFINESKLKTKYILKNKYICKKKIINKHEKRIISHDLPQIMALKF